MGEKGDKTNLASEFYVLSMLNRLGCNAYLTLGNKKSVDIVVDKSGKNIYVEVKGTKSNNFPINKNFQQADDLIYVFISFDKKDDPTNPPEVYVVPSNELKTPRNELAGKSLFYEHDTFPDIKLGGLRKLRAEYRDKWEYLM